MGCNPKVDDGENTNKYAAIFDPILHGIKMAGYACRRTTHFRHKERLEWL
jgi:hypothetical protein